jgi:hypothetical protein
MYNYVPYILLTIILIILIFMAYIKIKYKFWAIQPVFHVYNWNYMLFPPGIINHHLPEKNKYTNFENIKTYNINDITRIQKNNIVNFVRLNYLQNGENVFLPKIENIFPYFNSHNDKSYVSFYSQQNLMLNLKKGTTIDFPRIIGLITSRPIHIFINNDKKTRNRAKRNNFSNNESNFTAYYVDYLCVDKLQRKKGIAPQMIQTHHYNQSHSNKNIVVSLFKREDELTGIVPLCFYKTFGFSVLNWTKPTELNAMFKIIEINPSNFNILFNFIKTNKYLFDIFISVESSNIIELIKTKNIFINVVMVEHEIICAYFFRKSCTFIEDNMEVLTCFGSINICNDENIFIQGFKISFWSIAEKNYFGYSAIENISHNNIIIENITKKTKPSIISPTAYFFYNFAYPTFNANKTLILN